MTGLVIDVRIMEWKLSRSQASQRWYVNSIWNCRSFL